MSDMYFEVKKKIKQSPRMIIKTPFCETFRFIHQNQLENCPYYQR